MPVGTVLDALATNVSPPITLVAADIALDGNRVLETLK